jgi:hypothetical protein
MPRFHRVNVYCDGYALSSQHSELAGGDFARNRLSAEHIGVN